MGVSHDNMRAHTENVYDHVTNQNGAAAKPTNVSHWGFIKIYITERAQKSREILSEYKTRNALLFHCFICQYSSVSLSLKALRLIEKETGNLRQDN